MSQCIIEVYQLTNYLSPITIEMPYGAEILGVRAGGKLYALVTTDLPKEPRKFHVKSWKSVVDPQWLRWGKFEDAGELWFLFEEMPVKNA